MSLKRTVAPTELPLSLAEVQDHIRWESSAGDEAQIMIYLRSAVEQMDGAAGMLNRCIVDQTWELKIDHFPPSRLRLPLPPLQSVTSITYIDTAGDTQTLATSVYKVLNLNNETRQGMIELAYGQTWPSVRHESDAVTITFVAGYGARNAVPEHIRHLLLFTIQDAYDGRAPIDAKPLTRTPAYQGLFDQARFLGVA